MPEIVTCPQCDRSLRVPDELMGKQVKCPTCGTTFAAGGGGAPGGAPPGPRLPAEPPRAPADAFEEEPSSRRAPPRSDRDRDRDRDYDRDRDRDEDYDDDYEDDREERRRRRRRAARDRVSGPGTGLIVYGILLCILEAVALLLNVLGVGMFAANANAGGQAGMSNIVSGTVGVIAAVFGIGVGVLITVAGSKMRSLQSWGLCLAGSILAMIPCSICCLLGLPMGIWAAVVLSQQDVKDAFS
jgi:predicted Zn finger-like uncharacterized protein